MKYNERQSPGLWQLLYTAQRACCLGMVLLLALGLFFGSFSVQTEPSPQNAATANPVTVEPPTAAFGILGLHVSPDGQYLDRLATDLTWSRHDAHTGRPLSQRRLPPLSLGQFRPRSPQAMATGLIPRCLEVLQLPQQQSSDDFQRPVIQKSIFCSSVCQEQNRMAIATDAGLLWLIEVSGDQPQTVRRQKFDRSIAHVELSPAADRIAIVNGGRRVNVWDPAGERFLWSDVSPFDCRFVTWSGDGQWLLAFGGDPEFAILRADTGQLLHRVPTESQVNHAARLSHDGAIAAISETDRIRLWDVATGRDAGILSGHTGIITVLQFADLDHALFSGDLKGEVRRWSVTDVREVWRSE